LVGLKSVGADGTVGECAGLRDAVLVEQAVEAMKYGAGSAAGNTERVLVSNDLTLETSCTDFLVYASAGMITV